MHQSLVQETSGQTPLPPRNAVVIAHQEEPRTLYILLGPEGALKVGTCAHCVIEEHGRPARAWDAQGDNALDFDRDTLFAHLADLGIVLTDRQAYICP